MMAMMMMVVMMTMVMMTVMMMMMMTMINLLSNHPFPPLSACHRWLAFYFATLLGCLGVLVLLLALIALVLFALLTLLLIPSDALTRHRAPPPARHHRTDAMVR